MCVCVCVYSGRIESQLVGADVCRADVAHKRLRKERRAEGGNIFKSPLYTTDRQRGQGNVVRDRAKRWARMEAARNKRASKLDNFTDVIPAGCDATDPRRPFCLI